MAWQSQFHDSRWTSSQSASEVAVCQPSLPFVIEPLQATDDLSTMRSIAT